MINKKYQKIITRHKRIRAKVSGTSERPRLAVSKSNKNLIAQIIDDTTGKTLVYSWTKGIEGAKLKDRAVSLGKKIADLAKSAKIKKVVFDRGGYEYNGHIKIFAESARQSGLEF